MATQGFAKTTILGNVGSDLEKGTLPDENKTTVVNFSLAVNNQRTDPKSGNKISFVTWLSIRAFGARAEILFQYLKKGDLVHLVTDYRVDSYTNGSGEQKQKHYFVVNDFTLLPNQRNNNQQQQQPNNQQQQQSNNQQQQQPNNQQLPTFDDFDDDQPF